MRVDKANLDKSLRELGEGRSLVMEELSQPRPAAIFKRGTDRGDTVSPGRRPSCMASRGQDRSQAPAPALTVWIWRTGWVAEENPPLRA
jgi:hypothetical protein